MSPITRFVPKGSRCCRHDCLWQSTYKLVIRVAYTVNTKCQGWTSPRILGDGLENLNTVLIRGTLQSPAMPLKRLLAVYRLLMQALEPLSWHPFPSFLLPHLSVLSVTVSFSFTDSSRKRQAESHCCLSLTERSSKAFSCMTRSTSAAWWGWKWIKQLHLMVTSLNTAICPSSSHYSWL